MSVAFVKEDSAQTAAETQLPERQISAHPNLVTENGLKLLRQRLEEANVDFEVAQKIEDVNERRRSSALSLRDLVYFTKRLNSAQLILPNSSKEQIGFGDRVTFSRRDGRHQTFAIVGEDEAEPRQGSISYVSPVARVLVGRVVGDVVEFGTDELEILQIA